MRRCLTPIPCPVAAAAPYLVSQAASMTTTSTRRPRRHLVVTPYDSIPVNIDTPPSTNRILSSISDEAGVPTNWRELSPAESKRLLEVLPSHIDRCKENNIKIRRLHTYMDLRRAAGHKARRRLHRMMDEGASDTKLKSWCSSHMFPAEP